MVKNTHRFHFSSLTVNNISNPNPRSSLPEIPTTDDRLMRDQRIQFINLDSDNDEHFEVHQHLQEASDTESCTSNNSPRKSGIFGMKELVQMEEGDKVCNIIKRRFISGLGDLGNHVSIDSIQKRTFSNVLGQVRVQSFKLYLDAMAKKCNGNPRLKYAWYGIGREGLSSLISHGFSKFGKSENGDSYGIGVYLSPDYNSFESVKSTTPDEDGLRHLVLCRVILGNSEEIRLGSEQFHPSSLEFDSGVDNLTVPTRYIIWSTSMNTHILPEYVVSFKTNVSLDGFRRSRTGTPARLPKSPWMAFDDLIAEISKHLDPLKIRIIQKFHKDFCEKKISRQHLVHVIRRTTGDKMIVAIIQACRTKMKEGRRLQTNI